MVHFFTWLKGLSLKTAIITVVGSSLIIGSIIAAIILTTRNSSGEVASEATTRQEEITETETIGFKTIEKEDDSKSEGTTEKQQEGKNGEKSIKYIVVYDSDGNEISREKISEEITIEPIDEIIVIGTKKAAPAVAQKPASSSSVSSNTATQTQDRCKTELVGWGRPTNCPQAQTRAEYTALGGWEKLVENFYSSHKNMEPLKRCDGTTCVYERSGSMANLCYGSISVDMDTLTVLSVRWDNQPTSTCDAVRDEYPPLPSTDYLTQHLRSVAK